MPRETTTWPLDPHTQGKHLVLQYYMEAWLPIMTTWNGRVLFIDAFAGPGEYSGCEPGSPLVALRAFTEHSARKRMKGNINYLFIEKDPNRCGHLRDVLRNFEPEIPENCRFQVFNSTFDETLTDVLDRIDEQNKRLAPSFVMIDPFGVSDTPMKTIGRILSNPKSEVYVSFMFNHINRFKEHPNFERHLDELFGCSEWRHGLGITNSVERKDFFFGLYKRQLKSAGAKQVLHFELYEGQRLVYAIFFGTQNLEGCDKMKQAIWKVAPFGDYRFHGGQNSQLTFGTDLLDFSPLEKALHEEFGPKGWTRIEDMTRFVKSDATEYHSGHLKLKTLNPMEKRGEVEAKQGSRKRPCTYPDGTELRFVN